MKFEDFKGMSPYNQEMILLLERIAKALEELVKGENERLL